MVRPKSKIISVKTCVRCPPVRVDRDQRQRLIEIRDNLTARIAEAEREGWPGEADGLRVSLAAAKEKLAQVDGAIQRREAAVNLGMLTFATIADRNTAVDPADDRAAE